LVREARRPEGLDRPKRSFALDRGSVQSVRRLEITPPASVSLIFVGIALQGAAEKRMRMVENYKGHTITASASHIADTHQWQPEISVIWPEGKHKAIKYLVRPKYFATESEAEREGLEIAKKWIDDGKPDF
jgi:hypothetical protein